MNAWPARTLLQREPVELAALLREIVSDTPNASGVTLDLAACLPALALDRTRIRLLVRNQLDNALRYSVRTASCLSWNRQSICKPGSSWNEWKFTVESGEEPKNHYHKE